MNTLGLLSIRQVEKRLKPVKCKFEFVFRAKMQLLNSTIALISKMGIDSNLKSAVSSGQCEIYFFPFD